MLAAPVRTKEHTTESAEVTSGMWHHEAPRGGRGVVEEAAPGGKVEGDIWIHSAALATVVTVTARVAEKRHNRTAARLGGLERQGERGEGERLRRQGVPARDGRAGGGRSTGPPVPGGVVPGGALPGVRGGGWLSTAGRLRGGIALPVTSAGDICR